MPNPQINDAARQAQRIVVQSATQAITQGMAKAYRQALQAAADQAQEFQDAFKETDTAYRQRMFQDLGEAAQRSMLSAYGQLVTRNQTVPSYRSGNGRLSGGVLRRAIGSSEFFTATADGLEFGNIAFLDAEAKHWHRINFGALGRGEGSTENYRVEGFGTELGLNEPPSAGFSMPPGFWIASNGRRVQAGVRGSAAFYPSNEYNYTDNNGNSQTYTLEGAIGRAAARTKRRSRPTGWRPTQGIEAANFMDAGIRRIAEELPGIYTAYIEDLYNHALRDVKAKRTIRIVQGSVLGTGGGVLSKLSLP